MLSWISSTILYALLLTAFYLVVRPPAAPAAFAQGAMILHGTLTPFWLFKRTAPRAREAAAVGAAVLWLLTAWNLRRWAVPAGGTAVYAAPLAVAAGLTHLALHLALFVKQSGSWPALLSTAAAAGLVFALDAAWWSLPVALAQGAVVLVTLQARHTTSEQQEQIQHTSAAHELEVQIHQRTQQLAQANQQLAAALLAAQRAEESKISAYRMLSHELRAPLTSIKGLSGSVVDLAAALSLEEWQPLVLEDLQTIGVQSDALLQTVDDLLALARAGSGQLHVQLELLDVCSVVYDVIGGWQRLLADGVTLTLQLLPAIANTDRTQLRRVCSNLISNAVKYTTAGEITVKVTETGKGATIEVRDSGPGIPTDKLAQIFEPFCHTGNTPRKGFSSTGLGLPLSRALVEAMGGTITVQSKVGQGSTFRVLLPGEEL